MTNSLDSILAHLQFTSVFSIYTVNYIPTIKQVQLHILLNIVQFIEIPEGKNWNHL